MDIGIGLPTTIPAVEGHVVVEWARLAERRGFSSLGTIDRIVYGNYEPLIALTAAAAVTERVRLMTTVLLTPLHANSALFAKQTASIDRLSKGRLVLGLAIGGREDDYTASGLDYHARGKKFDAQLDDMTRVWAGESRGTAGAIGPTPVSQNGPTILLGGQSEATFRRLVKYGSGWVAGGGGPDQFRQAADAVRQAWTAGGRTGQPRLVSLAYYSLGPQAKQHAESYLRDYYSFARFVDFVVQGALVSEGAVTQAKAAYEAAGCDELIYFPCNPIPARSTSWRTWCSSR
jgi:alkanesulfonate monooxygenase SsuD/methylene tetrahydromethanopterin reductase-like flavin-dependent oxidoreductase (luciferase family)